MYSYFNNQPFLDAFSGQTAEINRLEKKNGGLTVALCVVAAITVCTFIKMQQYRRELNKLKDSGYRLY